MEKKAPASVDGEERVKKWELSSQRGPTAPSRQPGVQHAAVIKHKVPGNLHSADAGISESRRPADQSMLFQY